MNINYKTTTIILSVWVITLTSVVAVLAATGTTDSPAAPGSTNSYTLEDIYDRLDSGAAGTQSTFTEPSVAPGTGTMHDLNDIMSKAPALDNTNGATSTHVLAGQTFWGLTASQWATQTGTMPNNGAGSTIVPMTTDQSVASGYWSSANTVAGDTDLDQWNIRSGVTIFEVTGKCYRLPATGQTTAYSSGDDGTYQYGCRPLVAPQSGGYGGNFNRTDLPWSSSSGAGFTDNGDGTVTDNVTGLIWLKNANCFGTRNWSTALGDANTLASGSCGLTDGSSAGDWRLPNLNELRSLIDPAVSNPALPTGHPFTGVQSDRYWSSTTFAPLPAIAWFVDLSYGSVHGDAKAGGSGYVWPVRGGQ